MQKKILRSAYQMTYYKAALLGILSVLCFLAPSLVLAEEGVCAGVKIEIVQELAFERQAFIAKMRIVNTLNTQNLENIKIDVDFEDDAGNPVEASSDPNHPTAIFFITVDGMYGINDISGGGTIAPDTEAEIHWLIIPSAEAAGGSLSGKLYFVGATLEYMLGGELKEHDILPDFITVKPQPEFELDYFLTQEVRADDPFTPEIEPPEPFTLGVRIMNTGLGNAGNVTIDSAQPKIVENEQGLLIGFQINGSYVNDDPVHPTLLLSFGDMLAGDVAMGRWIMETTLSGEFKQFSAHYSHADELGGWLTSLLNRVSTHFLIKDVIVDLPGRDSVLDFLADDGGAINVYESNGVDAYVNNHSAGAQLVYDGSGGNISYYHVDLPPTAGPLFIKVTDPHAGDTQVYKVVRDDGKVIADVNSWISLEGSGADLKSYYNLFDVNGGGRYDIELGPKVQGSSPPVIGFIPNYTKVEEEHLNFTITASDPDGTIPSLSLDSKPFGSTFVDNLDGTGEFDWQILGGQAGTYPLTFRASDGEHITARPTTIFVNPLWDTDGDGMADEWEVKYFGDLSRDGTGDFDGDGLTDMQEYELGADPTFAGNAPTIPAINLPPIGGEVTTLRPQFEVQNSVHGKLLPYYTFEIYQDDSLMALLASGEVQEQPNNTFWMPPEDLEDNTHYVWRVRAESEGAASRWIYGDFFINTGNDGPSSFSGSFPFDGAVVGSLYPVFEITNSNDVDGDNLTYAFEIEAYPFSDGLLYSVEGIAPDSSGRTTMEVPYDLFKEGGNYRWRAIATDEHGASTVTPWYSFLVSTENKALSGVELIEPLGSEAISTRELRFRVKAVTTSPRDDVLYVIEVDKEPTFDSPALIRSEDIRGPVEGISYVVESLQANTKYYWRARASDSVTDGPWAYGGFEKVKPYAPPTPMVNNPGAEAWVEMLDPDLKVGPVKQGSHIRYIFELYEDEQLSVLVASSTESEPSWQAPSLENFKRYYWRARTKFSFGTYSEEWTPVHSFVVNDVDIDVPPYISLIEPCGGIYQVGAAEIPIKWVDEDPDSNALIDLIEGPSNTIASAIEEDPDGNSDIFVWDASAYPEGIYNLRAVIADDTTTNSTYEPCVIRFAAVLDGDGDTPPSTDGATSDGDGDKVLAKEDNCPFVYNPAQADSGGIGKSRKADGIGDACQCGDIDGDGRVTKKDANLITSGKINMSNADDISLCNVAGRDRCNKADARKIRRVLRKQKLNKKSKKKKKVKLPQRCKAALP